MKKIKRILALALALTLCLGLAATVFAALPSYDVIASRMSMSDSLNAVSYTHLTLPTNSRV